MNVCVVDDDPAICAMLTEIIEDEELGQVVFEAEDGGDIDVNLLQMKKVDILLIDLLMPFQDGIETIRGILPDFTGKVVMISQVETKELIGEAYDLGIEYYILKPINRLEVINVLQKVKERVLMERSIQHIQESLHVLQGTEQRKTVHTTKTPDVNTTGKRVLTDLGIISEKGSDDLLEMIEYLTAIEEQQKNKFTFPSLKVMFEEVVKKRLGVKTATTDVEKEIKASEQRVRRAIHESLIYIATLGLTDFHNPTFEEYGSTFFSFTQVRNKMMELQNKESSLPIQQRINTKKFVHALYNKVNARI